MGGLGGPLDPSRGPLRPPPKSRAHPSSTRCPGAWDLCFVTWRLPVTATRDMATTPRAGPAPRAAPAPARPHCKLGPIDSASIDLEEGEGEVIRRRPHRPALARRGKRTCSHTCCEVECFRRVKTGGPRGEGRARGAEIGGKRQVPGLERLPRHPLTPCLPPPLPRGAPPPLFTLRKHSTSCDFSAICVVQEELESNVCVEEKKLSFFGDVDGDQSLSVVICGYRAGSILEWGGGGGEGGKVGGIPVECCESLSTLKAGAIVAPLPDG